MTLSLTDRALLTLVRSGLWGQTPDDSESLKSLNETQWKSVLSASQSQTVEGLLWQGIDRMEDEECLPPDSLTMSMAVDMDKCEKASAFVNAMTEKLFSDYENRGLHPVLLKGPASAALYECPQLRTSGDIDIFFPEGEFTKAIPSDAVKESDGGYVFVREGITVELHPGVLDVSSAKNKEFIDTLIKREGFAAMGNGIRTTTPLVTMLLLNTHLLKHCIGRGVGLRQCCDYARARRVLKYDRKEYEDASLSLGIERWTEALDNLVDCFLESGNEVHASKNAETLLGIVLSGGNFGRNTVSAGASAWRTLGAFMSHMGFSMKVAPCETIATITSLAGGRFRK